MLGNVLRAIRTVNDKTISYSSANLGVSQPYLTNVEKGIKKLSLNKLEKFSELYNISISKIYELDKLDDEKKLSYMELLKCILDYYLCEENEKNDCHQKVKRISK